MIRRTLALALCLSAAGGAAMAQGGRGGGFPDKSGEELYKGVCQGCHMPDAKGAAGAGMYPALAGDKKLGAKAYPVLVVLRGQKAMPEFGSFASDAQVADVVNYVRTHFGNAYTDMVTPADVKALRPRPQPQPGAGPPPPG